jgi:hypothetical protein
LRYRLLTTVDARVPARIRSALIGNTWNCRIWFGFMTTHGSASVAVLIFQSPRWATPFVHYALPAASTIPYRLRTNLMLRNPGASPRASPGGGHKVGWREFCRPGECSRAQDVKTQLVRCTASRERPTSSVPPLRHWHRNGPSWEIRFAAADSPNRTPSGHQTAIWA